MMATGIITLFFIGIGLVSLFLIGSRSKRQRTIFNVTNKVHFTILKRFIVLLLIMTIAVELFYPSSEASHLPPKATEHSFQNTVFNDIIEGNKLDTSMLVAERTHLVGDKLMIEHVSQGYDHPDILIERKAVNDGVIEELIYKSHLIFNDYDFASITNVTFPDWNDDTISVYEEPVVTFEFVFIENTAMLNQFISEEDTHHLLNNFSSSFRAPVIHLIVPKDLEIIDPNDQVIFVDEWREEES